MIDSWTHKTKMCAKLISCLIYNMLFEIFDQFLRPGENLEDWLSSVPNIRFLTFFYRLSVLPA